MGALLFCLLLALLLLALCADAGSALGALYSHATVFHVQVVWVEPPHGCGRGL